MAKWHIRQMADNAIVHSIEITGSPRFYERKLSGLLTNMNRDDFFVDTSETDEEERQYWREQDDGED